MGALIRLVLDCLSHQIQGLAWGYSSANVIVSLLGMAVSRLLWGPLNDTAE